MAGDRTMNLCITPEVRKRLVKSTARMLYEQSNGFMPHHSTHLGIHEDDAEMLVDNFIDELESFSPTLTY
ncbi:MAG: hypothetical protein RR905_02785 [Aurantimicrobium sp.]